MNKINYDKMSQQDLLILLLKEQKQTSRKIQELINIIKKEIEE